MGTTTGAESSGGQVPGQAGRRCVISGRVQGVYYRGSAQQRALQSGLVGHAHNLPDGTVEVLCFGDEQRVTDFVAWLWIGPSAAKVANVAEQIVELERAAWPRGFTTA
jgi:acylphosphatase